MFFFNMFCILFFLMFCFVIGCCFRGCFIGFLFFVFILCFIMLVYLRLFDVFENIFLCFRSSLKKIFFCFWFRFVEFLINMLRRWFGKFFLGVGLFIRFFVMKIFCGMVFCFIKCVFLYMLIIVFVCNFRGFFLRFIMFICICLECVFIKLFSIFMLLLKVLSCFRKFMFVMLLFFVKDIGIYIL